MQIYYKQHLRRNIVKSSKTEKLSLYFIMFHRFNKTAPFDILSSTLHSFRV